MASNVSSFGEAGQRWLVQLKPDPLDGRTRLSSPLVENTIYAAPPQRDRSPFRVTLWSPAPHPEGDFVCRVSMSHKPEPFDVGGVDPLQALVLAITYIHVEFGVLGRDGWRFYLDPTDDEPFDPCKTYFPPSKWEPAA